MFRFACIASLTGTVEFSHYFESIPSQLIINLEKDIVTNCLKAGDKEVWKNKSPTIFSFKKLH